MKWFLLLYMSLFLFSCQQNDNDRKSGHKIPKTEKSKGQLQKISEIPAPMGYLRKETAAGTFPGWLRSIPLKKDKTVYLFNGKPKINQSAQFAVLDISTGNKDLQQCADVVIRLRAEYLFANKRYNDIKFIDFAWKEYQWGGGPNRQAFDKYLDMVFGWCGSASLEKQLKKVISTKYLKAGDVFIKGGFPGHAILVADVAENTNGDKVFLLIQGYTPAQDIHLLINPLNKKLSPWYELKDSEYLFTPEWTFHPGQLRSW